MGKLDATADRKGGEYRAKGQAVAELCRPAGADEALIPQWIEEGRRRAEIARMPPPEAFARPGCGGHDRGAPSL